MSGFAPSKFQFLQTSGAPNASGQIYVYQTGTTTPITIYNDGALTSPASNPLTLDSNGEAKFYVAVSTNIRIDSYTSTAGFIETIDPVFLVGTAISSTNAVTYKSSNFTLATNQANLNIVATSALTITLPATTGFTNTFQTTLNAQGGNITLSPNGTDNIQGKNANFTIQAGSSAVLWTDANGNWGLNFYSSYGNAPVVGAARNATMSVASASASATFSADSVVVATALNGGYLLLPSYSQTINLATTGAGGMDTGSAPTSGYVSLYAISKADGTQNIVACNVTSSSGSIYSGGHIPSGYIYSALIGIWPTTSDTPGKFIQGYQVDRSLYFAQVTLGSSLGATSFTSLAINSFVPPTAKTIKVITGNPSSSTPTATVAGDANGTGQLSATLGDAGFTTLIGDVPIITSQTIYYKVTSTLTLSLFASSYTF